MERILTAEQMKNADLYTTQNLGISPEILIERAGQEVANQIKMRFLGGRVLVCIGKGNNGQDGKVVATILSKIHGFSVITVNVDNGIFKIFDKKFDIIVDCIFGTGLNREVEGKYKKAIEKINQSGAYIVSCDIPSGLNGTTGEVMGVAVKANLTVAIQELKTGLFLGQAKEYCGEIVVKDIGISVWEEDCAFRLTDSDVSEVFSKRKIDSNKGDFGRAGIIGGSLQFSGSVVLSHLALSALRVGSGYSTLVIPNCIYNIVSGKYPEITYLTLDCDGKNAIFNENTKKALDSAFKCNALSVGMGMGVSQENYKILSYIIDNYLGTLIIDADGLNTLSKYGTDILKNKKCQVVLTPHIKEFSRLSNIEVDQILKDSVKVAKNFASEYGVILLLKNYISIITDGQRVIFNANGNPGLAKGGSGDLLSGIIVGICCRESDILKAVSSASYLLGKSADLAVKKINEYSLLSSDVIEYIPKAINEIIKSQK